MGGQSLSPDFRGIFPYSFIHDYCRILLENVLKYKNTEANYGLDSVRVIDGINDNRNPYKSFGTCMICTSHGAPCLKTLRKF